MKTRSVGTATALAAALAAAAFAHASATDPVYVGNVGPVHGAWTMNGRTVVGSEAVPPGATFAATGKHVARGTPRSISIFMLDGRLVTKSCLDDASCAGRFTVGLENDTANADAEKANGALQRYRLPYATPASRAAFESTPADGVVPLDPNGGLALGTAFAAIEPGSYRVELRSLDPNTHFAASDPVSRTFEWTGDAGVLANAGVAEGLYSIALFSKGGVGRELGSPAWIVVLGDRAAAAAGDFARARVLTAKWHDPEAVRTFLRAYLTSIATAP